ncbi:MAG: NAD(P)-dependent oxidoreductase [Pseudomonadota bacterium]
MKVLVTGSSGWLGRYLMPMLRAEGHEPLGLDAAPGRETHIVGSVADGRVVRDAVFAVDAVIHGAALHKPDIARYPTSAFVDTNVTGTLNLIEAAQEAGHNTFVFTSTTSVMVTEAIRAEMGDSAVWLDETTGSLAPRNIYGVTKLAAEGLCRIHARADFTITALRTSRFFPEEDDTHRVLSGQNMKANEFLNRRLTVEDAARAHVLALKRERGDAFEALVISASPPFQRSDVAALKADAAAVVLEKHPQATDLYAERGWSLPRTIGRVYDPARAEDVLGFRARTNFAAILTAMAEGDDLPFAHDASYASPLLSGA